MSLQARLRALPIPRTAWIVGIYGLVLLLLSLWVTRPLVSHFDEAIPFGSTARDVTPTSMRPGDSTQLHYWLWLFKENVEGLKSPLYSPYEYGPLNPDRVNPMGMWGFPLQLPFTLFAWLLGTTAAFNLLILLSFPLTALAQVWLCRLLGARWPSALIAGTVYGFAMARRVQMFGGHANGWLYLHLPLLVGALYLTLARRSWRWALVTGAVLISIALGEWHCFYYSSLFLGPAFLFFGWRTRFFHTLRQPASWVCLLVLTAFAATSLGYAFWLNSTFISGSRAEENRSRARVERASPSAAYLVLAERYRTKDIWGGGDMEPSIYLGNSVLAMTLALLLIAVGLGLRGTPARASIPAPDDVTGKPRGPPLPELAFFAVTGGVAVLLSLGIQPWLPPLYELLYDHLPFWHLSRVPPRLIYVGYMGLAVSFALLFDRVLGLLRLPSWGQRLAIGLAGALVLIDLVALSPRLLLSKQHPVEGRSYDFVRALSVEETGPLLFFPIYSADYPQNAAFQGVATQLRRPFLNGYAPTAPLAAHELLNDLRPMNQGRLSAKAHCKLWSLGTRFVVHDRWIRFLRSAKAKPNALETLVKRGQLEEVQRDEVAVVYRLLPPDACP